MEKGFLTIMKDRRNPKPEFPEYAGLLAEPMPTPTLLSSEAEQEEWTRVLTEKMHFLMRHFDVDPADPYAYVTVALKLARRHVPGFSPRRRAGRPRARNDDVLILSLVTMIIMQKGVSESEACRIVEKARVTRKKAETLRKRYRALRPVTGLLRRVADQIGEEKTIAILAKTVDEMLPPTGAKSDSI
jgi:hypothetical protein